MVLNDFRSQVIEWDKATGGIYESVSASKGDSNGRKLIVHVLNEREEEDLTGSVLSLAWNLKENQGLDAFVPIDETKGIFEIYYTTGMLSNIGTLTASLVLVTPDGRIESKPFKIFVQESVVDDTAVQSQNSFTTLTQALVQFAEWGSRFEVVEQDYKDRAAVLETTYAPRLIGVEGEIDVARGGAQTLGGRLDSDKAEVTAQLAEIANKNVVYVTDFGADPTGVLDSTSNIRNAIASIVEGVVYFPKGKYRITDTIRLKSNITIQFESQFSTFIYPASSMNTSTTMKYCFNLSAPSKNITLLNIGIDGSDAAETVIAGCLFEANYPLDGLSVSGIYAINQYQTIKLRPGTKNVNIDNVYCDIPTKSQLLPPENAVSCAGVDNIVITNIQIHESAEVIDLSQTSNFNISNVIANSSVITNEAFDIGGCDNGVISNAVINGYSSGIKLKQEGEFPEHGTTRNITLNNCRFNGFKMFGVYFLTNMAHSGKVIHDIKINNCTFESDLIDSAGFYNLANSGNTGMDNIEIVNCYVKTNGRAMSVADVDSLTIDSNTFITDNQYNALSLADSNKVRKDYTIKNNKIKYGGTGGALYLQLVENSNVNNNKIISTDKASALTLYLLNCKNNVVKQNIIEGGLIGFALVCTSEEYLNSSLKDLEVVSTDNVVRNFGTYGIRMNLNFTSAVTGPYKFGVFSNNKIMLDETNTLGTQIGMQFRSRLLNGGFDYMKVDNNLIYRVPTAIAYDQATFGENCTAVNNTVYTGA